MGVGELIELLDYFVGIVEVDLFALVDDGIRSNLIVLCNRLLVIWRDSTMPIPSHLKPLDPSLDNIQTVQAARRILQAAKAWGLGDIDRAQGGHQGGPGSQVV